MDFFAVQLWDVFLGQWWWFSVWRSCQKLAALKTKSGKTYSVVLFPSDMRPIHTIFLLTWHSFRKWCGVYLQKYLVGPLCFIEFHWQDPGGINKLTIHFMQLSSANFSPLLWNVTWFVHLQLFHQLNNLLKIRLLRHFNLRKYWCLSYLVIFFSRDLHLRICSG